MRARGDLLHDRHEEIDRSCQVTQLLLGSRQQQRRLDLVRDPQLALVEKVREACCCLRRTLVPKRELGVRELELDPSVVFGRLAVQELTRRTTELRRKECCDGGARLATTGFEEGHIARRDPVAGQLSLRQTRGPAEITQAFGEG